MIRFLFWNIQKKDRTPVLIEAIAELNLDCIFLAEAGNVPGRTIKSLRRSLTELEPPPPTRPKVRAFIDLDRVKAKLVKDGLPYRHRFLKIGGNSASILVAAAHLSSSLHRTEEDWQEYIFDMAAEIMQLEKQEGLESIVLGDLNFNPYDRAVVHAKGLHGMMDMKTVLREGRTVERCSHKMYYNPMWSMFGDRRDGPPGTYYWLQGRASSDWHIFDQVLLRPSLVGKLGDVRILDRLGRHQLSGYKGRPELSDHFPVYFEMNI